MLRARRVLPAEYFASIKECCSLFLFVVVVVAAAAAAAATAVAMPATTHLLEEQDEILGLRRSIFIQSILEVIYTL